MARFYAHPYNSTHVRTLLITFLLVFVAGINTFAQTVTSFAPTSGSVGTEVTITGTGFTEAHTVSIGAGATYDFTIVNDSEIKVKVPTSSSSGVVRVSSNQGAGTGPGSYTIVNAPVINSIAPTSGPVGTEVTITGSNLSATTAVTIGSGSTTNFTIGNAGTEIRVIVPASASNGSIRVSSSQGSSNNSSNYTLTNAPVISNFNPSSGPVGTEVTITGSNFSTVTSISIGSGTVTNFTKVNDTELKVTIPSSASNGTIKVNSNQGSSGSSGSYTLVNAPVITSFTPSSGPVGTEVVIRGTNFTGTTSVAFVSGAAKNYTVVSDTEIRAIVPENAKTGSISVRTDKGIVYSSGVFTVIGIPTITTFSPSSGPVGTEVVIRGTNFTGTTSVAFVSGAAKNYTVVSDTEIRAIVPENAKTGSISVRTDKGIVYSSGVFTVIGIPTITTFSPSSGPVGTEVVIRGTNFTGTTSVAFVSGAAKNYTVVSDTEIRAIVPENAKTGSISVRTDKGIVYSSGVFTVIGIPTITTFSPSSGPVGTEVVIRGTNFTGTTSVAFVSGAAKNYTVVSDTEIRAIVPENAKTGSISVRTDKGIVYSSGVFTVIGIPTITTFSPSSGPVGTEVVIRGTNFTGTTSVAFVSGAAKNYTVVSDTEIRAIVPENAKTGSISVRTDKGIVYFGYYELGSPYLSTTTNELSFNKASNGSSQTTEYSLSGLGLKNGEEVTVTLSESSPFTISTNAGFGFGKSVTVTGVENNRLNPIPIYVKYTAAEGDNISDVITHSQGTITKSLNVRVITPLPVELTAFNANLKNGQVNLNWTTASEKDNSHFEIEKASGTSKNFRKIDIVNSKVGTSSTATNYSFSTYYNSNGATEYYRLKQVDLDGTPKYSKVVSVKPSGIVKQMEVAPNPVNEDSKIYFTADTDGKAIIRATSVTGKQIYFEQIDVHGGENVVQLSEYNKLMPSVYIVTVEHSGKRESVRIEKK